MAQEGAAGTPDLRPLGVGEILDVSIKVYTRNLRTFIGLVAFIYIPIGLVAILGLLSVLPEGSFISDNTLYLPPTDSGAVDAFFVVLIVLAFLGPLISTGAGSKAVADAYLGRKPSIGTSYAFVGKRFHSLLWLSLLWVIIVFLGTLALFVPAIYLLVALSASVPVLVVEGLKGTKALSRSFNLVQGRWWRTFAVIFLGVILIPGIIQFAIIFLLGMGLEALGTENVTTFVILNQSISTIAALIATPIQVAVLVIVYFDHRVRKEAFDLQLLADRLGSPPDPDSATLHPLPGPGMPPPTSPPPTSVPPSSPPS
jgi:hypothetical protein